MKFNKTTVTIRSLVNGYVDSGDNGVIGFEGKLNIRPEYQREFVYKDKQRNLVIDTITNNFPLGVMYWAKLSPDSEACEIIDGQQRTISICQYAIGQFSFNGLAFHNLTKEEQDKILDYKLDVYICDGTERDKLDFFKRINIVGEKLTDQELRNAVYHGPWLSDAKKWFSKPNGPAYATASDLVTGSPIRQDYLEAALDWISNGNIEGYMSIHQHEPNASALWRYFQDVATWAKTTFPNHRKQMRGVNWGVLYNQFKDTVFTTADLEVEIVRLILDDDVTKKSGVYPYVLTRDERYLSVRAFSESMKTVAYEKQGGICPDCAKHFEYDEMEGDHHTPWSQGGKTTADNCVMLCRDCNRTKSDI